MASPPSWILGQDAGFPGPHLVDRVLREFVGKRDVHSECVGTSLRPPRRVDGEVILYVDPVGSSPLGIVENEEDRHLLMSPQMVMPHVGVAPGVIVAFPRLEFV